MLEGPADFPGVKRSILEPRVYKSPFGENKDCGSLVVREV